MTPTERRNACVKLLAEIDQRIAECEDLRSEPVLAHGEEGWFGAYLGFQRKARERVERLLSRETPSGERWRRTDWYSSLSVGWCPRIRSL